MCKSAENVACCCFNCALSVLISIISAFFVIIVIGGVLIWYFYYHEDKNDLDRFGDDVKKTVGDSYDKIKDSLSK